MKMMKEEWRPQGWENPYIYSNLEAKPINSGIDFANVPEMNAYEMGANAMLKAIQEECGLYLFTLDYSQMPAILRDNQQVLVGIKLEEGELPVYLSAFTSRGDYILRNLIITGKPVESD